MVYKCTSWKKVFRKLNLVEFDLRIIEFYSQNIEFKNEPLGLFKLSNKKD